MDNLTANQIEDLNNLNILTQDMFFGTKIQEIITAIKATVSVGTPVNAVNATMSLAVSGVVIHGESVTIDNPAIALEDIFQFAADVLQTVGAGNIPVDITSYVTASLGTLTMDTQPEISVSCPTKMSAQRRISVGPPFSKGMMPPVHSKSNPRTIQHKQ